MARILMTVPPLTGHINPALAVAGELRARGHQLAWAAHTDWVGEQLPREDQLFCLPSTGITTTNERAASVRGLESVRFFYEEFSIPLARSSLACMERIVRSFDPELMICDHQMLAGALVARALGIAWLSFVTTNVSILKMRPVVDAWVAQQLQALQAAYTGIDGTERPDFSPHGVIVFSSAQLLGDYPRVGARYHFVGPALSMRAQQIDFPWQSLRPGQCKLLISLGSVSRDRDLRFYRIMMAALADAPIQVVMVAPESLVHEAPANFVVRPRIPQLAVLKHMDAVVCHAGHNTVCESLLHGLPLIVAPIRDDQPIIARQVVDAGAGISVRYGKVSAEEARAKVQQLLGDVSLRESAQRLAESFRHLGGARRAADILEQQLVCAPACR